MSKMTAEELRKLNIIASRLKYELEAAEKAYCEAYIRLQRGY